MRPAPVSRRLASALLAAVDRALARAQQPEISTRKEFSADHSGPGRLIRASKFDSNNPSAVETGTEGRQNSPLAGKNLGLANFLARSCVSPAVEFDDADAK